MANQTTHLDLIQPSSAAKEVISNALDDAGSPGTAFGRRASTTTGLTWGYYGGIRILPGSPTILSKIANGTILLTASATNYIEINNLGAVVKNVIRFTGSWTPLYKITTGTANVTNYEDWRYFVMGTTP